MNYVPRINRRSFLASVAASGGALTLGFTIPSADADDEASEITAWVVIQPDDTVIIRVARPEMGQGNLTSLSMLVAEELECDWSKVKPERVSADENLRRKRVWGDMYATGSRSIRGSQEYLRKAGATARTMLVAAAANQWGVPTSECHVAKSVITHTPSGRTLRFGQLAETAAKIDPPKEVTLKDPKDWELIGKPQKRFEIIDKIQGKPIYAIDVRVPNMLYAAIMHSPVFKGKLKSVDDSKIGDLKGIRKVVKLEDAVAVVADTWWRAKKGLAALAVTWDEGENGSASSASIRDFMQTGLTTPEAGVGESRGNVAEGLAKATTRIEAEYATPFLSHATMEPMNCTAHVTGDKVEIWVPTQSSEGSLAAAADQLEISPRNVVIHSMLVGGGFGRRGGPQDFVRQAVLIAKEIGQPVKTVWSREEDIQHDYYRPATLAKLTAGLDASGTPVAWQVRLAGGSIMATFRPDNIKNGVDKHMQEGFLDDLGYDVPDYVVSYGLRIPHVPVGFWRGVNSSQNAFYKESFIDEMAHATGQDPYQFRRKLFEKKPKFLAVLDAVAKKADWGAPLPSGVYRGIAIDQAYDSYVAHVVEASVSDKGQVKVHRVVAAIDPGYAVNPLTIEEQAEGSVVWALTAALYGEITIKDGRVEQGNFDDYEMVRLAETPKVETVIVPSGGFWGGVGEPFMAPLAPALCNAIFAATGKRIRALPLKNQDLRKA
jgi:isoquinoline 1-oxidoreductase beta subunit